MQQKDITIVSDLHLGSGYYQDRGRYARMEEFFYDHEFSLFVEKLISDSQERHRQHVLVLNGDILDFLSVDDIPSSQERSELGIELGSSELKFGLGSSERRAVWKTGCILRGHPLFFKALARFLYAGHEIVYIRGNHDLEIYWKGVRELITEHLRGRLQELGSSEGHEISRLLFRPWFHIIGKHLYIEHGHQYDETNAVTANLNPLLPKGSYGSEERLLDYPIGSLFARFVYAPIRSVDPYRVHVISFTQYLSVVRGFNLWEFIRTVHLNFPFFVRTVRNSISLYGEGLKEIRKKHQERLTRYAQEHGYDEETLRALDDLRERPLGHSMHHIFVETFRPILKKIIWTGVLSVLSVFGWILIFTALPSVVESSVLGRASIISVLAVLTVVGLFALLTKVGQAIEGYEDPLIRKSYAKAVEIAALMDVENVVMGHTHVVHQEPIEGRGQYYNLGTWVLVPGAWDNLKTQGRQFTFLASREGELRLLKWDPLLREFVPPMVLTEERE